MVRFGHRMRQHFEEQLTDIERRLAEESGLVVRALDDAVRAFVQRDGSLAGRVVDGDKDLDHFEVELERLCLDTMARQQPMAGDLRFLAGALKINSDLERMGDLACNVAKHTWRLTADPEPAYCDQLSRLAESVRRMLEGAMDALVRRDANLARQVWALDTKVDELFGEMLDHCFQLMRNDAVGAQDSTTYVAAARNVERIGDHAQNISEDVVFIVEGRIVRHNVEARIAPRPPAGL